MDQIRHQLDADHPGVEFSDAELWAAVDRMQEDNQIMVSDNVVFLIWAVLELLFLTVPVLVTSRLETHAFIVTQGNLSNLKLFLRF